MKYQNPIILSDFSDPDCIRYKNNYYMISSSFNHTPIIPILKSTNLVDWKLIRYVSDKLPFDKFNEVRHGEGVWAPSIRYHNNMFYIIVPFPDEGIGIYRTDDIENGEFEFNMLIEGKGLEDPCPIWVNDKCYLVIAFVKSRIGFNSCLAVYEVSPDLKTKISDNYKIIFDGHNTQPTIEGPKFYYRNDYFYILAPAGSVKTGWQTALRSKNVYGPYEEKIVMCQNDSPTNGPHQGALVDVNKDLDVFFHFQDLGPYGRIVHLEPVKWVNDWPLIGNVRDDLLCGTPVLEHDYFIDKTSNYKLESSDYFKEDKLSLMWQFPANINDKFYDFNNGLILKCQKSYLALNKFTNMMLAKICYKSFKISTVIDLKELGNESSVGLCYMGKEYSYIEVKKRNGKLNILLKSGNFDSPMDEVIEIIDYNVRIIELNLKYTSPDTYQLGYNGKYFKNKFKALPGRWVGGKYGLFASGKEGYAYVSYFKVKDVK